MSACIWITGMSGSGKSTLANEVAVRLRRRDSAVVVLDGDALREVLQAGKNGSASLHHREARIGLAMRYARLCQLIASQGVTVVIATISLFREVHEWNRSNLPGYFEVYLKVPLEELRRRDPKGIYRRYDAGDLTDVAGLDVPIDEPREADWVITYAPSLTPAELADELMRRLSEREAN